jgi:hypothetical protein
LNKMSALDEAEQDAACFRSLRLMLYDHAFS